MRILTIVFVLIGCQVSFDANAGISWERIGPYGAQVLSLAIDPSDPNILYAGTEGDGIYKSTDSGKQWMPINNGISTNRRVQSVSIHPIFTNIVYIATAFSTLDPNDGIYKTTNAGISWNYILPEGGSSVQAHPNDPDRSLWVRMEGFFDQRMVAPAGR